MEYSFQTVASLVGFVGGLLGIASMILQLRDRLPQPRLTISQTTADLKVQKDNLGLTSFATVPALGAKLVNQGIRRLYPEATTLLVNGQPITATQHDLKDEPFESPLEYGQATAFAWHGQEIIDQLPIELRGQKKIKIRVSVAFANGKTCRSNQLTVLQTSLKSDLPILEFGF